MKSISKAKGRALLGACLVLIAWTLVSALPVGAASKTVVLEGLGQTEIVGLPLTSDRLNHYIRHTYREAPAVIRFSGFLTADDGLIDGHTMVVDIDGNANDVPYASTFAVITLRNARIGNRVGDLVLEQRTSSIGFVNSPDGVRQTTWFSVIEGTGDFKDAKGGGAAASVTSTSPAFNQNNYWLRLELKK
jgi:hypothetical protein